MNGNDKGLLNPTNNITRAEAVVVLGRVISNPNTVIPTPPVTENSSQIVYANGGISSYNKYHKSSNAHGMKDSIQMTENQAKNIGYIACESCFR